MLVDFLSTEKTSNVRKGISSSRIFTFRGSHFGLPDKTRFTWIFKNGQPIRTRVQTEYHYSVQQVRKFFDFCEISIGQNVSNFSPCFSLHLFDLCVCFAFAYTFLREHLSEADNEFVTENKLLFIQLSQK